MSSDPRKIIINYASAIISALHEKVNSLSLLGHKLTKGELRELFVGKLLNEFLPAQFGVGSGIILNQKGEQSKQTDIIIFDKRVILPFIKEHNIGIYPAECVVGTIEVKTNLLQHELLSAEKAAKHLHEVIFNPSSNIYREFQNYKPLCGIIGFFKNGPRKITDATGKLWLNENVQHLFSICLVGKFSWMNLQSSGWARKLSDDKKYEETKRFISIYLDNLRTLAEKRFAEHNNNHKDYLSLYIRDQNIEIN